MHEEPVQHDPLKRLCAALRACGPDEAPLRDLVIARLRNDSKLLETIVESDAPSYEGSMNTLHVFLSTKRWPEEDHGWIEEALTLARHGNWYSKAERPSYIKKREGLDRPGERITLEILCASVLLADCSRHATFSNNKDSEPGAGTCLDIVDAAWRLGGPWPEAVCRFLADHALFGMQNESWKYDPVQEATREVAVPLAMFVAWRSVKEDAGLPVRDLFEAINELALHRGVTDRGWYDPITCAPREEAPRVVRQTILDPVVDRLSQETREAVRLFKNRFIP